MSDLTPDPIATLREKALAYDAMLYAKGPWKARVEMAYVAAANPRTVLALLDRLAAAEAVVEAARRFFATNDREPPVVPDWYADEQACRLAIINYDRAIAGGKEAGE